jgi:phospho-N-acetylmuramoyl-pentapeptide-transferase
VLYHLLAPLAKQHILFNLLTYITFRAAGATVTALLLAFWLGPGIIRRLRERNIGQVIRAEGPASHHAKRGTPTMGGIIIILAAVVPALLWARLDSPYVVVAILATLWMGAIGFLDDYLKIVRGKSQGLVARWKLVGQITFGLALGIGLLAWPLAPNLRPVASTQVPLFKYFLLPFWPPLYVLFVTVVATGSSNAVNLTDGLDGLATGLTAIAAAAFAVFAYLFGRFDASHYLGVYFLPGAGELAIFCGALAGAALGFLTSMQLGGFFALLVVVLLLDAIFLKAHQLFEGEENGALFLFRHRGLCCFQVLRGCAKRCSRARPHSTSSRRQKVLGAARLRKRYRWLRLATKRGIIRLRRLRHGRPGDPWGLAAVATVGRRCAPWPPT